MGGKLPPYAVSESDGLPIVYQPWKIIFPNGTVTDVGDGTVYVGIGTSIQTTTSVTVSTLDARTPVLLAGTILYLLTDNSTTTFMNGQGSFVTTIEARSPLLKNASIMSIQTDATYLLAASPLLKYGTVFTVSTDGTATNFLNGVGLYSVPPGATQEARSPLLKAGTVWSLQTDGTATNFLNGAGLYSVPAGQTYETYSPLLKTGTLFSLNTANTTTDGFLLASDWNLFNVKVGTSRLLNSTSPLGGGGDLSADRTFSVGSLSSIGSANLLVGVNTNGAAWQYKDIIAGNNIIVAHDGTAITITANTGAGAGETIEARSPLLKAGTVVSILTDGLATTYLRGDGTYRSVYEARTPLLSAGTVLSLQTDGTTTNYLRGDGAYAVPSSNSGVKVLLFTVYSDASWTAEAVPIGQAPYETPITIKQINATVYGSTPELTFNIDHRVWGSLAVSGTPLFSSNQTATSVGFEATSFNSANIPEKAHLVLTSSAATGVVDYITGAIYYSRDTV